MDSVKFVWAYLLKEGKLTTGKWSFFGGGWEDSEPRPDWRDMDKPMILLREKVKQFGINWDLTSVPVSSQENRFEGTFCEGSISEALIGDLVLNNGSKYKVGVSNSEQRFSNYAKSLAEFMTDKEMVKEMLGIEA